MKILQVIQKQQLRGAEIFTCQVSEELQNHDHQVDVAYLFDSGTNFAYNLIFFPIKGSRRLRLLDFGAYKRIADLVRANKYDIVQANSGDTLKYCVLSKLIFRWKARVVFRNANKMSDFIKSRAHLRFNQFLLSRVDHVISVSESCRMDVISVLPELKRRSVTIHQATFEVPGDAISPRSNAGVAVLINIASFVPEKNHLFLLKVFKRFRETRGNAVLYLVGDGVLRKKIELFISENGLNEHVRLLGYRNDVPALLAQADVMIMPSLIEGLPGVILESVAHGVPVIASAVGGIPELIRNDVTGICLENWNEDEYCEALDKVLNDELFRNRLITNAMEHFKRGFTIPMVTRKFMSEYSKLLSEPLPNN